MKNTSYELFLFVAIAFFQNFSCRTHQNSTRKRWNKENFTNILAEHIFICQTDRTLIIIWTIIFAEHLPQSCQERNTVRTHVLVLCTARWLFSNIHYPPWILNLSMRKTTNVSKWFLGKLNILYDFFFEISQFFSIFCM